MIPTKIIHKHHFGGRDPRRLTPDDHLYNGDCRLLYEGGATTIAKFCCQITNEQFGKVQFAQKKLVIMLIKMAGYRHFPHVNNQSKPKRVCIWTRCFHLHVVPANAPQWQHWSIHEMMYIFTEQSQLSSALMLFNILMVII